MKKIFGSISYLLANHRKTSVVSLIVVLILCPIIAGFVINEVMFKLPEQNGFSLSGHQAIVDSGDKFGTNELVLISYGKDGVGAQEGIPMVGNERYSAYRHDPLAILPSGTVVYAVVNAQGDAYRIKKYENGTTTIVGVSSTTTIKDVFANYVGGSVANDVATSSYGLIHSFSSSIGIGICSYPAGGMNFWAVLICLSYEHNALVLDKDGTSRTVFSFDELAFPYPKRFMQLEALSVDKSLVVVKMGYYGEDVSTLPTYAYNIANNKWALLTDKATDRVLYLR